MGDLNITFLNNDIMQISEQFPVCDCYVIPKQACTYASNYYVKRSNCVYFLIDSMEGRKSPRMFYVGQTTDFAKRMSDHSSNRTWWDKVIVFCFQQGNSSLIQGLERIFIEKYMPRTDLYIYDSKKSSNAYVDQSWHKAEDSIQYILDFMTYSCPNLSQVTPIQQVQPIVPIASIQTKRDKFRFSMCNLKKGDIIYLSKDKNVTAVVADETHVIYNGLIKSLSPLTKDLLGMKYPPQGQHIGRIIAKLLMK